MPDIVLLVGIVGGALYGGMLAFSTGSYIPFGAGLCAGGFIGATGCLLVLHTRMWMRKRRFVEKLTPIFIYLVALLGLAGASGSRMFKPSQDNHFVYLADSFNHGKLKMLRAPPHGNDWARVTEITFRDGRKVRGTPVRRNGHRYFKTTKGKEIELARGSVRERRTEWYVSFPPLPATVMMPGVALWGYDFNDVLFTLLIAALNPVLCFFVLEALRRRCRHAHSGTVTEAGSCALTVKNNLWLTLFFCFGTVHFYCAVLGQVWYTAQILGATLVFGYILASLDAQRPVLAGLFLGLGFVTRTPILFAAPFFLFQVLQPEAWKKEVRLSFSDHFKNVEWKSVLQKGLLFAAPVCLIGLWMALLNEKRFDSPFEFGHTYLNIRWASRIQRWGLFNIHYIPRNLSAAFTLLPHIQTKYPYVVISRHGMSLLVTTPLLFFVFWPKEKGWLHYACWTSIAIMAGVHLLYQNSGFVQFTYRFSLDYTPFLVVLLAMSGRRIGILAKTLLFWGVAIHMFGALSFGRWHDFYARGNWLFVVE